MIKKKMHIISCFLSITCLLYSFFSSGCNHTNSSFLLEKSGVIERPVLQFTAINVLVDEPDFEIENDDLEELSGMIPAKVKGTFWGHNDKGNEAELFRVNRNGYIVQKVDLDGIENEDWEAMTQDHAGNLYIGGFGDNDQERDEYLIYKLREPSSEIETMDGIEIYSYTYSDRQSHNCEAMFYWNEKLYLITKVRFEDDNEEDEGRVAKIFCIDSLSNRKHILAREVGEYKGNGAVTDAYYSKTYGCLSVLTYSGIEFFPVHHESDMTKDPSHRVNFEYGQCESLCFDGDQLIIGNEDGEVWRYPVDLFFKLK